MSDEQMDARLRAAGERWLAGTAVDEASLDEPIDLQPAMPSRPHRTLAMVSAAVVVVAIAIGGVVFAANRGSTSSPAAGSDPTRALQGVTWTDAKSGNTLVFLPGAVRVSDGCDNSRLAVIAHAHTIRFGKPIGMQSACGGGPTTLGSPTAQERASRRFYRVVEHGQFTWSLIDHTLRASANGLTISMTSNGTRPPGIVDQTWILERYNSPSGYAHDVTVQANLTFDATDGFVASDTCNTLNGTTRSTLATITFQAVKTSLVGCASPLSVQPIVDRLLRGTTRYEIRGDELILSRPHYDGLLVYRAK